MTKRRNRKVNEELFKKTKLLIKLGAEGKDLYKLSGLSSGTLSAIRNSNNLDEYKQKIESWSNKKVESNKSSKNQPIIELLKQAVLILEGKDDK